MIIKIKHVRKEGRLWVVETDHPTKTYQEFVCRHSMLGALMLAMKYGASFHPVDPN